MGLNFRNFQKIVKLKTREKMLSHKINHAKFNTLLYNHLTSSEGKRYAAKGWEKEGVDGVVKDESALPPEDPFKEIDNVLWL